MLGGLGGAQLVAQLDDLRGLDEDRGPRRRFVVDDATDPRPRGAADRDHVATAAHRDGGVGGTLGRIEATENRPQSVHHALARLTHVLARPRKVARCAIQHGSVRSDRANQRRLELAWRRIDAKCSRAWCRGRQAFEIARDHASRRQRDSHLGKRGTFECASRHRE